MKKIFGKSKKGITLIALVITIIIILILAGVTISILTTEDGLIAQVERARDKHLEEQAKEKDVSDDMANVIGDYIGTNDEQNNIDWTAKLAEVTSIIHGGGVQEIKEEVNQIANEDIGIGTDGNFVNMDLWAYYYDNNYYGENGFVIGGQACAYSGITSIHDQLISENGKITGTVPQYIYSETVGEFKPVISMEYAFSSYLDACLLIEAPVIPSTVINMFSTFDGCSSLIEAPVIPNTVIDMSCTFRECSSLIEAPTIPSTVTDMSYTFAGCSSLRGTIEINAFSEPEPDPSLDPYGYPYQSSYSYGNCFEGACTGENILTITGSSTKKAELAATCGNGNVRY